MAIQQGIVDLAGVFQRRPECAHDSVAGGGFAHESRSHLIPTTDTLSNHGFRKKLIIALRTCAG